MLEIILSTYGKTDKALNKYMTNWKYRENIYQKQIEMLSEEKKINLTKYLKSTSSILYKINILESYYVRANYKKHNSNRNEQQRQ